MIGRHIHLQPVGGIAGDMFVAAMLDAFPHCREQVFSDVAAVLPAGLGAVQLTRVLRNGIAALHFFLEAEEVSPDVLAPMRVPPGSGAAHRPNNAGPEHDNSPASDYAGIRKLIESARLSGSAALHALAILEILALAESRIHNVALESVHFHELAAWDSIMDVVAAGSLISTLGEATWSISALPLGGGEVRTRHGMLPIPAPATMRILESYSWRSDNIPGERVTPTGAAIVRYLIPPGQLSNQPEGIYRGGGYGAGTRNFPEIANVLRVMAFEKAAEAPAAKQASSGSSVTSVHDREV